jgi:AraC family transcriptional regulator
VGYIESHLRSPLSVEQIASESAYYSLYHYVRLFRILTGETPGSYLRKRRLAEAARELVDTDRPILEIALEYQFQSHEAFSRAFKKQFGLAPGEQRKRRQFLHLAPRAAIGDVHADAHTCEPPRLFHAGPFLLAGVAYHGDNSDGRLAQVWQAFSANNAHIPQRSVPQRTFGLWQYPHEFRVTRDFDYLAAVAVNDLSALPQGIVGKRVAATTYAAFEHHGPIRNIRQTYVYAYGSWLPGSGYQLAGRFDLESYDERFLGPEHPASILSIWIPICPAGV